MWKNIVERGRPQMTIWFMGIACWIRKVTNTHSQYVILTVFPLLQLLNKSTSMLHYTYFACIVKTIDIVIQILFPRLFFPCNIYPHNSINCEVLRSQFRIKNIYIYIYIFLCSTWRWPFRPKHVVEYNRINCVLTGLIVIIIAKEHNGDEFSLKMVNLKAKVVSLLIRTEQKRERYIDWTARE